MKTLLPLFALCLFALPALAGTTQTAPHEYFVDEGVEFLFSNDGSTSFLVSWSDTGGTFTDVEDPSFILEIGQTYVFRRTTSSHPLGLTDGSLPTSGTDGSYQRTTTDSGVIQGAQLTPLADFTADPAPTTDAITWTPTVNDLGNYFYTCLVASHVGMTGGIRIVPGPVPVGSGSVTGLKAGFVD